MPNNDRRNDPSFEITNFFNDPIKRREELAREDLATPEASDPCACKCSFWSCIGYCVFSNWAMTDDWSAMGIVDIIGKTKAG
jgi:hypothetical protein